ncbi:hypothetical protein SAOR_07100 [Salinisphaera orenii MK-B5]|uniref:Uncharacterized protein n=1 Tax=Salinisphaera orenii MK-B5 TaxID=856730 RepID=A0A423PQF4_9GAMM|nr:hypothetical protein SAOR_07100 [Salinisphaera orenii MK-B5]
MKLGPGEIAFLKLFRAIAKRMTELSVAQPSVIAKPHEQALGAFHA